VQLLYFQFGGSPFAIPLDRVAEVAPAGPIHPVPLSPPAVKGLAERRGRPIAVIDLPRLLDASPENAGAGNVVRLAIPLDGAAFWVPAEVFSGTGTPAEGGRAWIEGRLHVILDTDALVRRAAAFA